MKVSLKLADKVLVLVCVPIVFMLVFVGVLSQTNRAANEQSWQERHARDIVSECNGLMHSCMDAGAALYLYSSTRQKSLLERFEDLVESIPVQIQTIKLLMRDDPGKAESIERLEKAGEHAVESMKDLRNLILEGVTDNDTREHLMDTSVELVSTLKSFIKEQRQSQRFSATGTETQYQLDKMLIAGVVASVILAVVLAVLFNRSTTDRLLVIVDDTKRLGRGDKLNPMLGGGDEIAELHHVFHQMAGDLAAADRMKAELLSVVSHDLRAPLTSVQGSLTLLEEGALGELTPQARKAVRISSVNVERLVGLINDLLDIEKMKAGKIELNSKQLVVEELFDTVCQTLSVLAEQKGVSLEYGETDAVVFGDYDRLMQVLTNLVSNAIKFSPKNCAVTLAAVREGNGTKITVSDCGRGVPADKVEHIFERFHQVEKADEKQGSGLGLSICKSFVEAHGGQVGVYPGNPLGSVFWFFLPDATSS